MSNERNKIREIKAQIDDLEDKLEQAQIDYLKSKGWQCNEFGLFWHDDVYDGSRETLTEALLAQYVVDGKGDS